MDIKEFLRILVEAGFIQGDIKEFLRILVEAGFIQGDTNIASNNDLLVYLDFPKENTVDLEKLLPLKEIAHVTFFTGPDGKTQLMLYFGKTEEE